MGVGYCVPVFGQPSNATVPGVHEMSPLKISLDSPRLADRIDAGAITFSGWCFHPEADIDELQLIVNRTLHPTNFRMQRADVAAEFPECRTATSSGFTTTVTLKAGVYAVGLRAVIRGVGSVRHMFPHLLSVGSHRRSVLTFLTVRAMSRWHDGRGFPDWRDLRLLVRRVVDERRHVVAIAQREDRSVRPQDLRRLDPYEAWLAVNAWTRKHEAALRARLDAAGDLPRISIVTPVFRPSLDLFLQTASSVTNQVYRDWEWCLADDASDDPGLSEALLRLSADPRIRVDARRQTGHISRATNTAAALATGEFLAFLDHDDLLSADALGEVALYLKQHPDTDVLYSDDDKVDLEGSRFSPHFKPDWSPEALLSQMYLAHLLVVRRSLFQRVGGLRPGYEGSQDHDLALRVTELTSRVAHIPLVLYHWRAAPGSTAVSGDAKPYSFDAAVRAVDDAFQRRSVPGHAARPDWAIRASASLLEHRFPAEGPTVAVLIPSRNHWERLDACLRSLASTSYRPYEIVVLDDHSDDEDTVAFLDRFGGRVLRRPGPRHTFNFAALCNDAVRRVDADLVAFLNDDVRVRRPEWLSQLVGFSRLSGVGAVGARLLFPNGTVQHAGIIQGFNQGDLALAFRGLSKEDPGYLAAAKVCRNYGAVTAACMLTPRALFLELGGFDEQSFPVSFNDVDYCYRLERRGYRCVYAPGAELTHDEGASRGSATDHGERARFRQRYRDRVEPYFNPNLSCDNERFEVRPRRLSRGPRRSMAVVLFSHAFDLTGAPLCQLELVVGLRDRGVITPHLICSGDGPLRRRFEQAGISVQIEPGMDSIASEPDYEHKIDRLLDRVRPLAPEVIHANTLKTFYAIDIAQRLNVSSVWSIKESEPWQTYFSYLPRVVSDRAVDMFTHPYRVVFASNATRAQFARLDRRRSFCTVHDGLPRDEWAAGSEGRARARSALSVDSAEVVVLTVGTVCERKGQADLVESLAQLDGDAATRIRCYIVGDRPGPYSRLVAERAAGLPPALRSRIHIVPETDDVRTFYRAADVFVCSSRIESYPRVTLEAMASGLPIISTPVFGLAEQLAPGVNAMLYQPGDCAALAAALARMVREPSVRTEMAKQSVNVLGGLKTFDETLDDYESFFREAAEL
jgi:GT2 family glycosyltransferase